MRRSHPRRLARSPVAYLNSRDMARWRVLVDELTRMSRDWSRYHCDDWQPLERELEILNQRGRAARDRDWNRFPEASFAMLG